MTRVALYARVSDDKKKQDGGREQDVYRQVTLLKEFITRTYENEKELTIAVYVDDGKSAYTEDWNSRPQFKKLIDDCRRHNITHIYVEDMTRFSRNVLTGLQLLKELGDIKVQVISLREGEFEVTSAKGWMQSLMLLMFAEWDSRIKSEKVKSGMQKKKNLGKHIGRPSKRGGQ